MKYNYQKDFFEEIHVHFFIPSVKTTMVICMIYCIEDDTNIRDLILKISATAEKQINKEEFYNDLVTKYFDVNKITETINNSYLANMEIAKKIINIYPKNIVNSGWSEKPYIKRIQVPSFLGKTIPLNNKEQCSLFLGIAFVNNKPIFAVWNPFTYVFHKTNRSCYVNVESLDICYHNGLYKTIDSKKEIILCDKDNFGQLLEIYFEENC